jgi:hypothetical protein
MSGWRRLNEALDAVADRGEAIRLWWRDDDAGRDCPALDRLLDLAELCGAPIALAVVPAWLDEDAQGRIAASAQATVLQHGFAHADHAPPGAKKIELGGRDGAVILAELARGRDILRDAFGATFLAVLVPPWNRLDAALIDQLAACGFVGLSTFGRRAPTDEALGLVRVNAHLDPVDWHGSRLFVGEAAALTRLCEVLDPEEPIGILSHHLAMDEAGWRFFEDLLGLLRSHPGAQLCAAPALFARPR